MPTFFAPGTAQDAKAVTPSDSDDLPNGVCQALWVGTSGNLSVITAAGTTLTLVGASGLMQIQVKRVRSTGTTAADIAAWY